MKTCTNIDYLISHKKRDHWYVTISVRMTFFFKLAIFINLQYEKSWTFRRIIAYHIQNNLLAGSRLKNDNLFLFNRSNALSD